MTPDAVAEHALTLAAYVEAQRGLIDQLLEFSAAQRKHIEVVEAYSNTAMIGIRRVQSLLTRGQKAAAIHLIGALATEGPPGRSQAPLDFAEIAEANELPPGLFNPAAPDVAAE